jgi:hypothetical protein
LGEEASNTFRIANRVVLPNGTVIKDREAPVEIMVHCPFHKDGAEDNPSMRVLPDGTFFCFACEAKGHTTDPKKPECFVRHPATLYKLPPPDDDKATESADESHDAWVKYAKKLQESLDIAQHNERMLRAQRDDARGESAGRLHALEESTKMLEAAEQRAKELRDAWMIPRSVLVARALAINVEDATKLYNEYGVHPDRHNAEDLGVDLSAIPTRTWQHERKEAVVFLRTFADGDAFADLIESGDHEGAEASDGVSKG